MTVRREPTGKYRNEWTTEGRNILDADQLAAVRNVIENVGPVIVEHWHYYGSRSPDWLVFNDFDELLGYVKKNSVPGDAFHLWNFAALCRNDNQLAQGKYPDDQGRVPTNGAY